MGTCLCNVPKVIGLLSLWSPTIVLHSRTALVTVTLRRTWFSKDMKSQVQAMADSTSPSGTALWNWVLISTWWKPLVLMGSLILPLLLFGPCIQNCLSCFVMSHLEVIKLQMVMEMEPKMIYRDPLDRRTGGKPNCHPLVPHSSKKPDQSSPLAP